MSLLRELQERCYRAFALDEPAALDGRVKTGGVRAADRIGVYQNNFRETFRGALAASFPVVERLVGGTCFSGLAAKYTREHPSRSGNLQPFGRRFPLFLESIYGETRFAYLHDVARLEWALEEVHLEPDEPVLQPAALAAVAAEQYPDLVLRVRRAVRLVRSPYPVLSIWRANQPENDGGADLGRGGECVAVLRRGNDLEMRRLDPGAFAFVSACAAGGSLQEAWEAVHAGAPPGTLRTPDPAAALHTVMGLGLIAAFSLPGH